MRSLIVTALLLAGSLEAQEFTPPESARASGGVRFGLYGFAARGGADFEGSGQGIFSVALDVGHLITDRVRFRPSVEIGVGGGVDTYLANMELTYRFTPDAEIAVPYIGFGLGVFGRQGCDADPGCPGLWVQFALGFEIAMTERMGWMLEYHGENALRRHRFLVGLTTRRGR